MLENMAENHHVHIMCKPPSGVLEPIETVKNLYWKKNLYKVIDQFEKFQQIWTSQTFGYIMQWDWEQYITTTKRFELPNIML